MSLPAPSECLDPQVSLHGPVDETMLDAFLERMSGAARDDAAIALELTTLGGDADIGRRIALEIHQRRNYGKHLVHFIGKTTVYSAGVTIMSAFPRELRRLTHDCVLLIHSRHLNEQLQLDGPLDQCRQLTERTLRKIEIAERVQREDFERLIAGSDVSLEELERRAAGNWYLTARQALERGLVAALI